MKIAVLSDIHANAVALDAALADIEREQVDRLVCLGDLATPGPQPRAVLDRLYALGCPVVRGNVDDRLLDGPSLVPNAASPLPGDRRGVTLGQQAEIERWCAAQLTAADRAWLRTLPLTTDLSLGAGATALCFHGTPQDNTAFVRGYSTYDELDGVIGGYRATVLVAGHSHVQLIRRHKSATFVNVGSVGLAEERDASGRWVAYVPWAEYGMIRWDAGRLGIELRRVPFDLAALLQAGRASGMPHADAWATGWRDANADETA